MTETTTTEPRDKAAELEVLERFDAKRRAAGHDYGAGQRHRELVRVRREAGIADRLGDDLSLTDAEVLAAFERVARPRIARLAAEDFRSSTPATRRTMQTWERLERELRLSAKESAELDHAAEQRDFAAAHAEGLHDELAREGCPDCYRRGTRA